MMTMVFSYLRGLPLISSSTDPFYSAAIGAGWNLSLQRPRSAQSYPAYLRNVAPTLDPK